MMKAGIFQGQGVLEVGERPLPLPADGGPDWVTIDVEACGVCGTDLQVLKVPPGHPAAVDTVLGHEFVGRIREVGPEVEGFGPGDRVTVAPNLTCRELGKPWCPYCRMGRPNHCDNWTTIGLHRDGAFAPHALAPEKSLFAVDDELPIGDAIWIEPLSCVLGCSSRLQTEPGMLGAVIGAGPIGILHALMLKATGLKAVISDLSPLRLERAVDAGVDAAVNVGSESFLDAVMDLSHGRGADVVVDAVGGQLGTAVDCAAMMAQICCFGINDVKPEVDQFRITERELTIFGTFVGVDTFPKAIELLESGALLPGVLNEEFLSLQNLHEGIQACLQGEAVKVAVGFGGTD